MITKRKITTLKRSPIHESRPITYTLPWHPHVVASRHSVTTKHLHLPVGGCFALAALGVLCGCNIDLGWVDLHMPVLWPYDLLGFSHQDPQYSYVQNATYVHLNYISLALPRRLRGSASDVRWSSSGETSRCINGVEGYFAHLLVQLGKRCVHAEWRHGC